MGSEASSPLELSVPVWFNLGERRMKSQGLGKESAKNRAPHSQSYSSSGYWGAGQTVYSILFVASPLVSPMGDLPAICCRWSQVGETGYAAPSLPDMGVPRRGAPGGTSALARSRRWTPSSSSLCPVRQKSWRTCPAPGAGDGEQRRSTLTFSGSPASSSAIGAAPGRTLGAPPAVPHSRNAADPRE